VRRRLGTATGKVRALRLGLVVGLVGMAVLVAWSLRGPEAGPPASTPRVARSAVAGERGEQCTWMQVVGEEQSVGFEAPECFTEPDGTQRLTGDERRGPARVTVRYQAHGETDTLTIEALHGSYEPQGQKARFEGAVRVSTGLGLAAEMESVSYDGIEGIAESADAVTFSRKQLSGRGRGLHFDARKGRLVLGGPVEVRIAGADGGATWVRAERVRFDKRSGEFEFEGNTRATSGETRLTAERLRGELALPQYDLKRLVAVGNVRLRSAGGALASQAGLKVSRGAYLLECERVEIPLSAAGAPKSMQAGPAGVHFELQPTADHATERRTLDSQAATFRFDEQGRMEEISAHGGVLLKRVTAASGSIADEMRCASVFAKLEPASGEMVRGEFHGGVELARGRQKATAGEAFYTGSMLRLKGDPQVEDPDAGLRVVADSIGLGTGDKQGQMQASGHVRQTIKRAEPGGDGLLDGPELLVQCGEMIYNTGNGAALYRRGALLRSGADEVRAYKIQLRQAPGQRRLLASRRVQTVWRAAGEAGQEPSLVQARAKQMYYEESSGTLRFSENVELRQEDLTIKTPEELTIELVSGTGLGSLRAGQTAVDVTMGQRHATGATARYAPPEGRLVIEGPRVVYSDEEGRSLWGRALTLLLDENKVLVDGQDVQRTRMTIRSGAPNP